jgi:tetratricopeptide (TPR) repeat protein
MGPADAVEELRRRAREADRAGQPAQAIAAYEPLLALRPQWADGWYNLGQAQWRVRRFGAALVSYQRALDAGLRGPEEAHLNRAVILAQHLLRPDEALQELQTALQLNPQYLPAWLNLGNLHEQQGERDAARQAYERVLQIDPANALALSRLPDLRPPGEAPEPLVDRLRLAIGRPGATATDRADLGFGLGKLLDAVGRHDEAFAAYVQANRSSRDSGPPGLRYDAQAHTRWVDRLIAEFPPPAAAPAPDHGAPIFVCGLFRSGSTLVEQMLAAHPQVTAGGELDLLPALAQARLRPDQDWSWLRDAAQVQAQRERWLAQARALFPGAATLTDKRPDNFLHIGLIQALFPGARIVHTRRDPLDNALSLYFLHLGHAMPYALDLDDIAHWCGQYRRLMTHWQRAFGAHLHTVDYDRLVVDPEPVLRELLAFCGLPWDPAVLDFQHARGRVRTASQWQVRQPLYTRSSGRWRHYAVHLQRLRAALD